ncbi:MAG: plasmid maintenance system antidote protein family [Cyanobacteria bacterium RYN_339]|nr:plasmid maintenance system antidote protein family [Cyanobacteria bacterium RYN_339]
MTIPATHHTAAYWEQATPRHPAYGAPQHPGVHLLEDILRPLGVSIQRFSLDVGISYRRAHELVSGKRGVSAETALLLAKYLGMSPQYWLGLQSSYELELLRGTMGEKMGRVRVLPRPDQESSTG